MEIVVEQENRGRATDSAAGTGLMRLGDAAKAAPVGPRSFADLIARAAAMTPEERVQLRAERSREVLQGIGRTPVRPPRIPRRFRGKTLDSYKPRNRTQKIALAATWRWVEDAAAGQPAMLALIGETESGKSHLLYAAAQELYRLGHHAHCRPWYRLGDDLRYGSRDEVEGEGGAVRLLEREPWQVRRDLWAQRIICLDEVRPTSGTSFDDTELHKLACHAHDEDIALLITTNCNPLSDVLGPAAARRFNEAVITAALEQGR